MKWKAFDYLNNYLCNIEYSLYLKKIVENILIHEPKYYDCLVGQ